MTIQSVLITFGGSPRQLTAAEGTMCCKITAEPFNTNAGRAYVGTAGMTKASGVGVIRELAAPNSIATAIKERFEVADSKGANKIDASDYWFDGTNAEKMLVTIWTA